MKVHSLDIEDQLPPNEDLGQVRNENILSSLGRDRQSLLDRGWGLQLSVAIVTSKCHIYYELSPLYMWRFCNHEGVWL